MTYRRAVIPALVGGLLITLLLWWAGAGAGALRLPGTGTVFDVQSASELRRWLTPWAYEPPGTPLSDGSAGSTWAASTGYADLYRTAMQIRYVAVFAFFLAGALLLLRRIPPTRGRTPATLLALWAWGPVAGTLAVTVSAPWLIASMGRGGFRVLPRLASATASSGPVVVFAALVASVVTVVVARVIVKDTDPPPRRSTPPRAARLAASAGTAVIAFSLVILSYQSVAARIQTSAGGSGLLSEPGDLLRQWLLLGAWTGPSTTPLGDWLLYRAADVVMLTVVWWALRLLPGLLTRTTAPAMAVGAVCATVLALLASQLLHMAMDDTVAVWGPVHLFSRLGENVPAALTFGGAAGLVAFGVLRMAGATRPVAAGHHPGGETRTAAEDVHR